MNGSEAKFAQEWSVSSSIEPKMNALAEALSRAGSVLVCFSGGLDSGFLLAVARSVLGDRAVALTAVGPALAPAERQDAQAFAHSVGARHVLVDAGEIEVAQYVANGPDRCFHCKAALYATAGAQARQLGLAQVVNGTNVDDLRDYRPGLDAAREAGVGSPLVDAGLRKSEVREAAQALGLRLWDKPSAACLASRIPYGTSVTRERLAQIAGFEADIKALGFVQVRVRHHDCVARLELMVDDLAAATTEPIRAALMEAGKRHGFAFVTLDLGGYRTGSLNEVVQRRRLRTMPG
jgi:uncharacterized protein